MKITRRQLRQIIKEELSRLTEVDGIVPTDKVSQGVAKKLGRKMKWRGGSEREAAIEIAGFLRDVDQWLQSPNGGGGRSLPKAKKLGKVVSISDMTKFLETASNQCRTSQGTERVKTCGLYEMLAPLFGIQSAQISPTVKSTGIFGSRRAESVERFGTWFIDNGGSEPLSSEQWYDTLVLFYWPYESSGSAWNQEKADELIAAMEPLEYEELEGSDEVKRWLHFLKRYVMK